MASFQAPGFPPSAGPSSSTAPLVVLFERDDTVAIPLLSQVRLAGYDVRAARTPVELFDVLAKHPVALVLIDLGGATAGRREFWVALDARRRGKPMQVMTFRIKELPLELEADESPARALADVEVSGPHEFAQIIEAVRSRLPLHGGAPSVAIGTFPPGTVMPSDASPQFGRALGALSTLMPAFSAGPPSQFGTLYGPPGAAGPASSPFAQPSQYNPFSNSFPSAASPSASPSAWNPGASGPGGSPFSQPYSDNPFGGKGGERGMGGMGGGGIPRPGPSPFDTAPSRGGPSNPLGGSNPPGAASQSGASRPWGASQPGAFGSSQPSGKVPAQPSISDRWTPPDNGVAAEQAFENQETGVVPELASRPFEKMPERSPADLAAGEAASAMLPGGWMAAVRAAASSGGKPLSPQDEQALSNVLVEGAMLSPQTLEVLRGVQQMLSTVEMKLNIGELAMIFNFLSRDQYLAALLVSRGLVTPQQIASLGRVKQELAAAGRDYDLETLLVKYKVLRPDQLDAIRAELKPR